MRRIFDAPLVVVDTETTGLPPDEQAAPWEIGAVVLGVFGAEIDHMEIRGRPDVFEERHRSVVSSISHADPAEIDALPLLRTVIHPFRLWLCSWLKRGASITAYNKAFDREMLARAGITPYDRDWGPCLQGNGGPLWYAARSVGVEPTMPRHRALSDARTAAAVAVARVRLRT